MKKIVLLLFAVAAVALGVNGVFQGRNNASQREQIAALKNSLDQAASQVAELKAAGSRAERQRDELAQVAEDLGKQLKVVRAEAEAKVAPAPPPPTPPAPPAVEDKNAKGGFGKMLAGMMQDPDMKKFIRDQQRTMLNQLYDPLIRKLGLTPEEGDKFKELLTDNRIKAAERASSMFGTGSTNRADLVRAMEAEQKNLEDQVKDFLGEERFAQYRDYEKTVGERAQLNLFKQQNNGASQPLSDQQTDQLLALMQEEKQNGVTQSGLGNSGLSGDQNNMRAMLSEADSEKLIQSQIAANQRVMERARGLLWPDQLVAFSQFQTNQVQMMRMGFTMARKFMNPDAGAPAESK